MTELRIALAIVGLVVVLVVALISYDKFRLRRLIRRHAEIGGEDAEWGEPTLSDSGEIDINPPPPDLNQRAISFEDEEAEPRLNLRDIDAELDEIERTANQSLEPEEVPAAKPREQTPDDIVDFVAILPGDQMVARDEVLGMYRQHEYLLEKPHAIFGRRHPRGVWRNLDHEPETAKFDEIQLSIQLVDRNGPLNESELNRLAQLGLRVADSLHRPLRFSMSFEDALDRAQALDKFCRNYDVLAIINVVANKPEGFSGSDIERAAAESGLQFGAMNIYHRKNDNSHGCRHLFSMANLYKPGEFDPTRMDELRTRGLTLFMNIPCAWDPGAAFRELVECCRHLAASLDGSLTDRENNPLDDRQIENIRKQIDRIASEMQEFGVTPGSEAAVRLF